MKFCRDCEHFRQDDISLGRNFCHHPTALRHTDIVTGRRTYDRAYIARSEGAVCGPEAKLFKPPLTISQWFLQFLGIHDS